MAKIVFRIIVLRIAGLAAEMVLVMMEREARQITVKIVLTVFRIVDFVAVMGPVQPMKIVFVMTVVEALEQLLAVAVAHPHIMNVISTWEIVAKIVWRIARI